MAMTQKVSVWQLLWRMIRYAQRLYLADTVLWIFIMGLPAVPGLIIREFFNTLTDKSQLDWSPWTLIALLLATGLGRIVVIFTGRVTKTQHRFTMSALLRHNLLFGILKRPGAQPMMVGGTKGSTVSPGEVISYFRDDADQIEDNVVGTNEILGAGLLALSSVAILLRVNVQMTLLVFLPLAAIAAMIQRAETRIKRYRRASRRATQQVTGLIGEMFSAVQAIKVAGAEATVLEHFRQLNDRRRHLMVRDRLLTAVLESGFENLVSLGTGLILLLASQSMGAGIGSLTVGDFALFVYYLAYLTYFFSFLGGFLTLSKQTEVSFERMEALLGATSKAKGRAGRKQKSASALVTHHPLYLHDLWGRKPKLPAAGQPQRTERDRLDVLEVTNLTYRYPGTDRGISGVSLSIKRGSFTAITGRIGSGKTTLLRVLLGLLPAQAGTIDWNGEPVTDPANFFVPPRCAYTPQVPQLFSDSLGANILLGLEPDETAIARAIEMAVFEQDVAAMPEGLATIVGPKGMRLSGGQIQRSAATRMFVRRPELLVFDDLSSALDVETEQTLWQRLFAIRDQASSPATDWTPTCLAVSHRPSVLRRADYIIVLQEGEVVTEGHPDALLATSTDR